MRITEIDVTNENSHKSKATGYFVSTDAKIMDYALRPVVLIAPGGSYEKISFKEGEPIALKFNSLGCHAIVLNYSVFPAKYPTALWEMDALYSWVVENAGAYSIDVEKIYLCGFSAGGHLVANYACEYQRLFLQTAKIKGIILGYPVISTGEYVHHGSFKNLLQDDYELLCDCVSIEKNVGENFPETFVFGTYEDLTVSINNTVLLVKALVDNHVPVESHIFKTGVHGLALGNKVTRSSPEHYDSAFSIWFELLENWLSCFDKDK